ncbi:MAG TPA: TRAP transporter small permease subunit [Candidatus Angelobacter sp.]|nr:TRAP transporter small permease subunit [Candidatus Angelobacter sp.]
MTAVHGPGANGEGAPRTRPSWAGLLRGIIRIWALAGGLIIALLVLITAASALSNLLFNAPFSGEYELAKHFVGIAIFTFLPYCQLSGANVTVDIFTQGFGPRAKGAMALLSSLLAAAFAILLLRQMSLGFGDYIRYPEETAALHIRLWTAFPPILVSLALLLVASLLTAHDAWRGLRR